MSVTTLFLLKVEAIVGAETPTVRLGLTATYSISSKRRLKRTRVRQWEVKEKSEPI